MRQSKALVLSLLLLALPGRGFSAARDAVIRDCLKEITAFINPVDGYIGAAWLSDNTITFGWCGSGQACYDGEIREALLVDKAGWRTVVNLGHNSALNKERGAYSLSPRLVASPAEGVYVLNLNCFRDFPGKTSSNSGGVTGNVVLYDARSGSFANLTNRDGKSGKYVEALRWFPDERVLLLQESELSLGSDTPFPVPGTASPICINLDGSKPARATWPKIDAWYASRPSARVLHEDPVGTRDRQIRWSIESIALRKKIVLQCAWDRRMEAFAIPGGLFCVGNEQLGTRIYNSEAELLASISEVPLAYAEPSKQLLLRSVRGDEDGQYRYWLFDAVKYSKLIAPEALRAN